MNVQPLFTLEELIDQATDINNFESNDAQAEAVANQVNRTISGPGTAIKVIIQKLQMRQEVVTLQALNIVETCVKNCGVNFHNEVGKYRFINELIKLLSTKYDGDITPQSVKERVISLMYSWYVGLPQQTKIGEAYKMLKQQGIIKRDPVDPSRPEAQALPREIENTVFQDEGNTQLLKTLLSSKDADDLHSANKLIKSMVRQEEERLDRVSKRIQVLETVSNNVKLLDDMISRYDPGSGTSSLEIMNELYERCLTLRPELFRLASKNAEEKDDSVGDILLASDELTRVIDSYKENVLFKAPRDAKVSPASQSQSAESNNDLLLDLTMDSPAEVNGGRVEDSLSDDQFKFLDISAPATATVTNPLVGDVPGFPATNWNAVSAPFSAPQVNPTQTMFAAAPPISSGILPNNTVPNFRPPFNSQPIGPQNPTVKPKALPPPTSSNSTPNKSLLDFDVFDSDFFKTPASGEKSGTTNALDGLTLDDKPLTLLDTYSNSTSQAMTAPVALEAPLVQPTSTLPPPLSAPLVGNSTTVSIPGPPTASPLQQTTTEIPSAATESTSNYLVPLESLKSGKYDPIPVLDKDGVKTFLLIAEDTRGDANPNVIVSILSTISLNTNPLSDFNIQVAVPKVMRVKLQPATANHLAPFNPISAPPSISQIILIANPTKEAVKLRFKISYSLGNVPHVETTNVDNIPVR